MTSTLCYSQIASPVGRLFVAADDEAIHAIRFGAGDKAGAPDAGWRRADNALLREAHGQIGAYFAGERHRFELPLAPVGSVFQRAVWSALRGISFGETVAYADIAARIDRPGAARAVGAACRENPIAIVIPCHRVVGRNGALTGFAGGLRAKERLLEIERAAPLAGGRLAAMLPADELEPSIPAAFRARSHARERAPGRAQRRA